MSSMEVSITCTFMSMRTSCRCPRALGVIADGPTSHLWLSLFKHPENRGRYRTDDVCSLSLFQRAVQQPTWIKDCCRCQHWTDDSLSDGMVVHHKGMMPVLKDFLRIRFVSIIIIIYTQECVSPWNLLLTHLCSDLRDMLGSVFFILNIITLRKQC